MLARVYGTCDTQHAIKDLTELLIPLHVVDLVMNEKGKGGGELWCWIVKWVRDVLEMLVWYGEKGAVVEPRVFENDMDFGVSLDMGALKVCIIFIFENFLLFLFLSFVFCFVKLFGFFHMMDLCHTNIHCNNLFQNRTYFPFLPFQLSNPSKIHPADYNLLKPWVVLCCDLKHQQPNKALCDNCYKIEKMRKQACEDDWIESHCDALSRLTKQRLTDIYVLRTFVSTLLHSPVLRTHPITPTLLSLLVDQPYHDMPTAHSVLHHINSAWNVHSGNVCLARTKENFIQRITEAFHADVSRMRRRGNE